MIRASARCTTAVVAGLLWLTPPLASAANLQEGFTAATRLDAELRSIAARREAALARAARADSLLPGAPVAALAYRSDQLSGNRGLREYEGELDVPVWLPGEARALRQAAEAAVTSLDAQGARRRLLLAGEVRTAYWNWAMADAARAAAQQRVMLARSLERDTARQVRGGNMPQTEALLALADLREAEASLQTAELDRRAAAIAFRTLTGTMPSAGPPESPAPGRVATDPRIGAAQAAIGAAQREERLVAARDRANPEIGVQLRYERDAFEQPWGTRVLLRMAIPFQNPPLQRERLAEARAAMSAGVAELHSAERTVASAADAARATRETAEAVMVTAQARHDAVRRQAALAEAALRAGQLPLIELVRVRGQLADADAALRRARVNAARSVSVLNQAQGVLPE